MTFQHKPPASQFKNKNSKRTNPNYTPNSNNKPVSATPKVAPFELQTFDILNEYILQTRSETQSAANLKSVQYHYMKYFKESIIPSEPGTNSLYTILQNHDSYTLVITNLVAKLQNHITNDESLKIAIMSAVKSSVALALRFNRFKLKLLVIGILMSKLGANHSIALKARYKNVLDTLLTTHIIVDIDKLNQQDDIRQQIKTMITNITTNLIPLDKILKDMIGPLLRFTSLDWKLPAVLHPAIRIALEDIAPFAFGGIEKDFHYICFLLLCPRPIKMFSELQNKQFLSYAQEIDFLFALLVSGATVPGDRKLDLSLLMSDSNTINIPMAKFKDMDKCSNNTYSRIIESLNLFVYNCWYIVFSHCKPPTPESKPESTPESKPESTPESKPESTPESKS